MLLEDIKKIIDEDRICLHMQPIYSIKKNKFISAEFLVRLIDYDENLIYPSDFIPLIEGSKLMFKLEIKILQKACELLTKQEIENLDLEYIEINMSAKNAEQHNFIKKAQNIIDLNNIEHKKLNIEVTETSQPENEISFFQNLYSLRQNDFRISLDDFGTGTSNFQYLLNIPAKLVKLDMSLIQSAFNNKKSISIIHGIILISHAVGSKVVAEGVEDEKVFELLKDLEVDYIQGFYFSKPLPVEDFVSFINKKNN